MCVSWREHAQKPGHVRDRCVCSRGATLTCKMRHHSDWQVTSSQGWNIPRVTQLSRITSMDTCSNHVREEVKAKTRRMSFQIINNTGRQGYVTLRRRSERARFVAYMAPLVALFVPIKHSGQSDAVGNANKMFSVRF